MAPQSMADVYNSLYTVLCDEMRQALKEVYDPEVRSRHDKPHSLPFHIKSLRKARLIPFNREACPPIH